MVDVAQLPFSGLLSAFATLILGIMGIMFLWYRQNGFSKLTPKKRPKDSIQDTTETTEKDNKENEEPNANKPQKAVDQRTMLLRDLKSLDDFHTGKTILTADNVQV